VSHPKLTPRSGSSCSRQKPSAAANDPLAPIRRMSQAEKIAFFS
jgi:hypothetical protein